MTILDTAAAGFHQSGQLRAHNSVLLVNHARRE